MHRSVPAKTQRCSPHLTLFTGIADPTWESPECAIVGLALPETCHQGYGASDSNQMYYCPQTDDWCCGPAHNSLDCCANDATHFKLVRSEYSLGELVSRNRPTVSQAPQTCPERDIDLSIQPNPSFSSNLSCSSNTSCSSEMAKGAGIGVGVTSAVAVLAVLLSAFLIRRRRRNRNPYKQPTEEVIVQHHGGYAMPSEMSARTAILELPAERPK